MSEYTKRLHKFVNGYEFVRCFYGECPNCGKHVFSVGDDVIDYKSIKAKFICDCGKKWKETVYSPEMKKYKYPQALVQEYHGKKVLRLGNKMYLVLPDKIKSKEVKK